MEVFLEHTGMPVRHFLGLICTSLSLSHPPYATCEQQCLDNARIFLSSFKVYLKNGGKPDIKTGDFDLSYDLPDLKSCSVPEGTIMNSEILHNHNSGKTIHVELKNCSRDPYTVFVSNQDLNNTGKHCFGKSFL